MNISIVTYTQAMRIAVKYSMDDVQVAIAGVIQTIPSQPLQHLGTAILRLAFVAEFPTHFFPYVAIQVFTHASSIDHYPTADDLEPLMPYPAFVALMIQYREALRNPETAIWKKLRIHSMMHGEYRFTIATEEYWFKKEFGRFGFKPKF